MTPALSLHQEQCPAADKAEGPSIDHALTLLRLGMRGLKANENAFPPAPCLHRGVACRTWWLASGEVVEGRRGCWMVLAKVISDQPSFGGSRLPSRPSSATLACPSCMSQGQRHLSQG
eukprot:2121961-Amphidinium_carterae.1